MRALLLNFSLINPSSFPKDVFDFLTDPISLISINGLNLILILLLILILIAISGYLAFKNKNLKENIFFLEDEVVALELDKEKAENAFKSRNEFLSTVSHELRTPLNAIIGITHLLIEDNPKKSQENYLTSLQFSGEYLLDFINQILEYNKLESGHFEVENSDFSIFELAKKIEKSLIAQAKTKNDSLQFEVDSEIPNNLIGDHVKLSQILLNLITNAIKFTENGDVKVAIKLLSINKHIVFIYFEVSDTGIGIPEDKLEAVFESFSQGSVEINRKYGGTGLGLNIVKKLVEILGGKIKLESKIGQGTTFSFVLNFSIGDEIPFSEGKKYDLSKLANKKILLVEDNKINQMVISKMLENKKMICSIAETGEEGVELAKNKNYDLILMDIHLPGISGTTATENIRTFDKQTPIVALTAISLDENREMLLSFGMDEVITKPFNPEDFYRIIAEKSKMN
jgi:signal transduction histidine kinase/CheY-like chemotaxis protein